MPDCWNSSNLASIFFPTTLCRRQKDQVGISNRVWISEQKSWWKIDVYMVENCRLYGGKLSYIWWKIVAYMVENCRLYTACIVVVHVHSARIIARATIVTAVTLRRRFDFSDISDIMSAGHCNSYYALFVSCVLELLFCN